MKNICLIAAAAIVAGCATPPTPSVPSDILAGWNTEADCLRVRQKAGDIADRPAGGAAGTSLDTGMREGETRFLEAEFRRHQPGGGVFGLVGFKETWFAVCRRHIGDRA